MSEKNKALTDEFNKKKNDDKNKPKSKSWLDDLGPMKFEPRITQKVKTPQEKAEDDAYWAARAEVNNERKLEALKEANKNRPKTKTYVPDEKIGAKRTDYDYEQKKARWTAAFASGAGGR